VVLPERQQEMWVVDFLGNKFKNRKTNGIQIIKEHRIEFQADSPF